MAEDPAACRIRELREAQGLSQAELARRAEQSRQLVNLIERGKISPSVQIALRLAKALDCAVEELFSRGAAECASAKAAPPTSRESGPVRAGLIGARRVLVPVAATETAGFGAADGELISAGGSRTRFHGLRPEMEWRENLFVAGCDPALGLVRDLWARHGFPGSICWRNLPSAAAVEALKAGEVHVAGIHFPESEEGRAARGALPGDLLRIRFASWEQGWMLQPGNPGGFRSAEDLASPRFRLLNRARGAGSRMLLDHLLERAHLRARAVPGYRREGATHQECAAAIAQGRADVAIGLRAIAERAGLDFRPVEEVAFDLLVPRALAAHAPVERLLELLAQRSFRRQLNALPGYESRQTGQAQP